MKKAVSAVIIGAGHRSIKYASYALEHPEKLKIAAVVDPNPIRRAQAAKIHSLPGEVCFADLESLLSKGKIADCAINGTMDRLHVPTTLPLLKAGYDVLLEKPIATGKEDLLNLLHTARQYNRRVLICHVLRYAPSYRAVKETVLSGAIGDILHINAAEYVGYDHFDCGFVRGKWNHSERCGSKILLAKSCHDLDIISWLMSGVRPIRVSSFGALTYYRPENAPEGSGTRCALDCAIEKDCPHSAVTTYIKRNRWGFYAWECIEHLGGSSAPEEVKLMSLKTDNPYGRCVWRCDNNVYDHQTVNILYENGVTATFSLVGGAVPAGRPLRVTGTKGEIELFSSGEAVLRTPDPFAPDGYKSVRLIGPDEGDVHSGDLQLVEDFVNILSGETPSVSATTLEDSIYSHLIGFDAETSLQENRVVDIEHI